MKAFFVSISFVLLFACSSKKKVCDIRVEDQIYLSIEKTPCFGQCPIFKMELLDSSSLKFNAVRFMDVNGNFEGDLSRKSYTDLKELASNVNWNGLQKEYLTGYSDLPSTILSYSAIDGDTTVVRYESNIAPENVSKLGTRLSQIQKTTTWKSVEYK